MKITDMRYKLVAVAFAGMALSGSALAQSTSWAGPYFGGAIGIASTETKFSDPAEELDGEENGGKRKFVPTLGVFGGYNWQNGTLVYGIDATADLHGYKTRMEGSDVSPGHDQLHVKQQGSISIKGRVGNVIGNSLIYLSGGVAFGRFKTFVEDHGEFGTSSKWVPGLAVAVGLENMYSRDTLLRFQLEFRDHGRQNVTNSNGDSFGQSTSSVSVNFGYARKF
jgi:hypothetical protein